MEKYSAIPVDGVPIDNLNLNEALERIRALMVSKNRSIACFVNAESIVLAHHNKEYRTALLSASLRLVDGVGLQLAATLQGQTFKGNLNGTDLFPYICDLLNETRKRVFLLGSKPGVAEKVGQWIEGKYSNVHVVGIHDGYFSKQEESDVIKTIQQAKADLLLVGMGSPYQEVWIKNNLEQTGAKVALGVGGLFDYYSDSIKRAPLWIRKIGFEWLWRWLMEPWRWRRILRLIEFVWIILIDKDDR